MKHFAEQAIGTLAHARLLIPNDTLRYLKLTREINTYLEAYGARAVSNTNRNYLHSFVEFKVAIDDRLFEQIKEHFKREKVSVMLHRSRMIA